MAGMASMAGLLAVTPGLLVVNTAIVFVGPPLSWSGPNFGSIFLRGLGPVGVESELRLWPASVIVP